jgi:hypothetical protein
MANPRAFIAFDDDHDEFLRTALVGQSKHPDTDFEIADWSVKEPFAEREWEKKVRTRIRQTDLVIVICGQNTHWATGVATELKGCSRGKEAVLPALGIRRQDVLRANHRFADRQDIQMDVGQPEGFGSGEPLTCLRRRASYKAGRRRSTATSIRITCWSSTSCLSRPRSTPATSGRTQTTTCSR